MRQKPFTSPEEALRNRLARANIAFNDRMKLGSPADFIEHHGVKGMKWGVRKKDKTSDSESTTPQLSEKKQAKVDKFQGRADIMGTRIAELKVDNEALKGARNPLKVYDRYATGQYIKSLEKQQTHAEKTADATRRGKLTPTQKKVIVGVAFAGAVGVGVLVLRGQQSGATTSAITRGEAFLRGEKTPFRMNKELTGKMSANDLLTKVVKPVNPGYSSAGGKMNCRRSTYAYELRRRGFDVHATTSSVGWGQSESGVINAVTPGSKNFYRQMSMSQAVVTTGGDVRARGDVRKNPLTKIVLDKLNTGGPDGVTEAFGSKKVFEALSKQPEGSRGEVLFKFPGFGHSMAYEVVNGKPHIFDSQKGTYHDLTKLVEQKWGSFNGAEITRLDNIELDLKFLTRWADNY